MAILELENCSVDIPLTGNLKRSFRAELLDGLVGGKIFSGRKGRSFVRALDDITVSFKPGDRVGIVGPNGSGKSSLLRLLAGIYEPTSGIINREGTVSTLFDLSLGLDLEATGRENIRLMAIYRQVPIKYVADREEEIVEFSELGAFIDLPVRTYSSGMVLRLAFSVAVVLQGDILIMDEWLAVGDSDFSKKAEKKLHDLMNDSKIVVIATHDPTLVQSICNYQLQLIDGKQISYEPVTETPRPEENTESLKTG